MAEKEQTKTAEEQQEEETAEPEESKQAKPSNELKVVIIIKENKIMIGAQSPECDPVYETLTGTLAAALKRIPKLVSGAKQKWAANPKNPEANLPKPKPSPTPARTPTATKTKPAQPSFF